MSQESTELKIFLDNDSALYFGQRASITKTLLKRKNAGTYNSAKSVKAWENLAEAGAKEYARGYGTPWHRMFSVADRRATARDLRDEFEAEHALGNYAEEQRALETKAQRAKRTGGAKKRTVRKARKKNPKPHHRVKTIRELSMLVNTASPIILIGETGTGPNGAFVFRDALGHDHTFEHGGSELTRSAFLKQWKRSGGQAYDGTGPGTKKGQVRKTARRAYEPKSQRVNLTKAQAEKCFKDTVMDAILESEAEGGGRLDKPMRRLAWNGFVEDLLRNKVVTDKQAYSWSYPSWLETWKPRKKARR